MSTSELAIVIVNWNGLNLLKRCLSSIERFPPKVPYEIIVVDNASSDGSVEWLRAESARNLRLKLVENSANLGFGKANNQAFAMTDAPLLLLLNSDTEVTENAIDTLIKCAKSDERIGGCGPKLLRPDGSTQVSVRRNPPNPLEIVAVGFRLYKLLPKKLRGELLLNSFWDHSCRREAKFLCFAAVLIKKQVIDGVGGFDERYHMYHEDDEFCLRISRAGWKLVFEPSAVVIHHCGQSAKKRWAPPDLVRVMTEANLSFQRNSLSRTHYLANLVSQSLVLLFELTWRRLRKIPDEDIKTMLDVHFERIAKPFSSGQIEGQNGRKSPRG